MNLRRGKRILLCAAACIAAALCAPAQKSVWRQASQSELIAALPARAAVENEHIETEMRTASGIVDEHGRMIAGVVLLTAGYSADGKYSHYLVVQSPLRIGGFVLRPGQYAFGWTRGETRDTLAVHFNFASNGKLAGAAVAHRIADSTRLDSLHIWPPEEKSMIQIGRFTIPYKLAGE
jgi:hypothetical protein